ALCGAVLGDDLLLDILGQGHGRLLLMCRRAPTVFVTTDAGRALRVAGAVRPTGHQVTSRGAEPPHPGAPTGPLRGGTAGPSARETNVMAPFQVTVDTPLPPEVAWERVTDW